MDISHHLTDEQKVELKDLIFSPDVRSTFELKLAEVLEDERQWKERKTKCEELFLSLPLDGSIDAPATVVISRDELDRQGAEIEKEKKKWSRFVTMNSLGKEGWKKRFTSKDSFDLDAIREVPMHEVLSSEGIELRRVSPSCQKVKCPFHDERTPSFFVYSDNHAHCFGCSWHGDTIQFVMDFLHLNFQDACRHISVFI